MVCFTALCSVAYSQILDGVLAKAKESFTHVTMLAIEAAIQAGEILRHGFGTRFSISSKQGTHNLVTEYDHKSEKFIIDFIRHHIPHSKFLAEESGESGDDEENLVWIIDPLDGTVNFAHEIPVFSVSIAAEKKGEVISGVVFAPITNELFVAEKGKGAFLNGTPIRVTPTQELKGSILATGFPYNLAENPFHCIEHFVDILRLGIPIRRLGSAAIDLAYIAAGRFDGFFEVSLAPWDSAAGVLLVNEAGGKVTHWDQSPFSVREKTPILATNGHIHEALAKVLSRSIP
jgi:myo-inositol-1(or 4)-monophosphatase